MAKFVMQGSLQSHVQPTPEAYPGQIRNPVASNIGLNASGEANKIVDLTISSLPQTVEIEGVSLEVSQTDSTLSPAEELKKAIGEEPLITDISISQSNSTVTLTGVHSGDDFAVSTSAGITLSVSQAATETPILPLGRVGARRTGDDVDVVRLPGMNTDRVIGFLGRTAFHEADDIDLDGFAVGRGDPVTVLKQGEIYVESESDISIDDSTLFYRYAPDSSVGTKLGVLSNVAGTGKAALSRVNPLGNSFTAFGTNMVLIERY